MQIRRAASSLGLDIDESYKGKLVVKMPFPSTELARTDPDFPISETWPDAKIKETWVKFFEVLHPIHQPQTKREYWVRIKERNDGAFSEGSDISWEEFKKDDRKVRERGGSPSSVEIVKERPPSNGNGDKELPATIHGEPVPDKYRYLTPFIDEPLPPSSDILVPSVLPEVEERKIDIVMKQLADGVESIQDSSQFRLFLTTMSKFHNYSIGNLILIGMQKPEATKVAGFVTWKDLERYVKKGERGIAILAPVMPYRPKKEEIEDEEEEIQPRPVSFRVAHVFDISQTEGKPLPEFDVPVLTGEGNEILFANVLLLVKDQGLDLGFEPRPNQDPGIKGQYSGKEIWIKPAEPRAQQLKTALHELAHYYSAGVFRIPRQDAETIAESAAFAVGAHFGFDSGIRSFPYVALWSQDKKVLQANLASIRKVTTTMLEGIEKMAKTEDKLVPALKPFEPYHFAEFVLRYNRFADAEIPIYSGLAGMSPLRVPDGIWREVVKETEGEFVKQGELNVFHIPEKERPSYMRAAPTWRDIASTIPTKPCPKCGKALRLHYFSKTKEYSWGHEYPVGDIMSDKPICDYSEKAKPEDIASTLPTGTCYPDAWKFLIKEREGHLVHGTVMTGDKRVGHAWVETETDYIWEPETKRFYTLLGFENAAAPVEEKRYTTTEASVMVARTKNFGPWTDEEVSKYLKKEVPAVIPTNGRKLSRKDVEVYLSLPPYKASIWVENKETGETIWKMEGAEDINRFGWEDQNRDQLEERVLVHLEDIGMLMGAVPAVIPTKPRTPSPREELEFVSDSPELIPFTIADIGYRDKLDQAFEAAIARAKGG